LLKPQASTCELSPRSAELLPSQVKEGPRAGSSQKVRKLPSLTEAAALEIRREAACLEKIKGPNEEREDPRP